MIFTCPNGGCYADLRAAEGLTYYCPDEDMEISPALVAGQGWGD